MGAFFSFIFFFILVILFIGLILVLTVFNKVRDAFRQLKGQTPKQDNNTHINGNVVIDRRDPSQVNKKIIPKDEGEYVDFEDEKSNNE